MFIGISLHQLIKISFVKLLTKVNLQCITDTLRGQDDA